MSTHKQETKDEKKTNTAYGKDSQENKHLSAFILFSFFLYVYALKERNASDVKEPPEIAQEIIFQGIFPVVISQDAITVLADSSL
jgi:hypothetical protein